MNFVFSVVLLTSFRDWQKAEAFSIMWDCSGGSTISQRMGLQLQRWGRQPIILANYPKTCMKMKKIGPREEASLEPPGSADGLDCSREFEECAKFKILALFSSEINVF